MNPRDYVANLHHHINRLMEENESLRKDAKYWSEAHDRELAWSAQLIEEREELRKDAERYRFIRDDRSSGKTDICIIRKDWTACRDTYLTLEQADYAIDAAISSPENP